MKFGKTWEEKKIPFQRWEKKFVIFPQSLMTGEWAWLEIVERRKYPGGEKCPAHWKYKSISDANDYEEKWKRIMRVMK